MYRGKAKFVFHGPWGDIPIDPADIDHSETRYAAFLPGAREKYELLAQEQQSKTGDKLAEENKVSEKGGKKLDTNKPDLSLVPASALLEEAAVWTFGKQKYSAFNWHKGISYNRILAAIERHTQLLKAGITTDYETGRHHAAAIRCGCAMLIQFDLEKRSELDDRMQLTDAVKSKIEQQAKGEFVWDLVSTKSEIEK